MSNYKVEVSIIMPAYNCEETIAVSIESVLAQSYKKFELIIVNDGSSDNTKKVINDYLKLDKRIVLINQKNSGPSKARNNALKIAKGKYVMFIDADDEYLKNSVEIMVSSLQKNKVELVSGCYKTNYDNITKGKIENMIFQNKNYELIEYMFSKNIFNTNWNKIYLKDIISNNNISFDETIRNGEDMRFNLEYISCINSGMIISDCVYKYYYNEKGLTSVSKETLANRVVNDFNFQIDYYQKKNYSLKIISRRVCKSIFYIDDLDFLLSSKDYLNMLKRVKDVSVFSKFTYMLLRYKLTLILKPLLKLLGRK